VSSKTPAWEIVAHLQHNTDVRPESKRANMNNEPMEIYTVMEVGLVNFVGKLNSFDFLLGLNCWKMRGDVRNQPIGQDARRER
jgi:hypothetical protein